MKKILCWLLTLAICFGLAACGTPAPVETSAPTTVPTTTAPETTTPVTEPIETQPAETEPVETEPAVTEPALDNPGAIIDAAYALADGESLEEAVTLIGTISSIDTAWSEQYQNITVTIKVAGYEDKPIMCYRVAGEGAKDLAYGDVITVTGTIKNYMGIIEFAQGCTLDNVVKGSGEGPESPIDYDVIVKEAQALKPGQSLPYTATLTGRVESIDYSYSATYNDMSITIEVRGQDIYCFRLTSPRVDWLKQVGEKDWVTVMGKIKNYNGTIEFDSATMIAYTDFYKVEGPEDPLAHIDAAYKLKESKSLDYESTLTGVITKIDTEWDDYYGNISVVIQVPGREDKPILCYRLSGEGAESLAVGDTITVTGTLKNYKGIVEFDQGCQLTGEVVKGDAPVEPETPVTPPSVSYVTEPEAGVAYKLGLNQTKKAKTYFFTGAMSGFYGASEADWNDGIEVYLEAAAEGYYLYFTNAEGAKQYINLVKSGTHYNFTFGATAVSVFAFDADKDALCTTVEGELCYIGTYDNYVTFGVLQNSKLKDTDYVARLYVTGGTAPDDGGNTNPDGGNTNPDGGNTNPDGGNTNPDGGNTNPDGGNTNPDTPEEPFVKPTTPEAIVAAAYALEEDETLKEGPYTLTGVITAVNSRYNAQYGNVTVTIVVGDMTDKPIECYRLKGTGADAIGVGDTITVTGELKNFRGKIEFDQGCTLDSYVPGTRPTDPVMNTPEEIVNGAYALEEGKSFMNQYTLTGVITEVVYEYDASFGNVTVTMVVGELTDKPIECYRLKGTGADVIKVGDTITVTGYLKNHYGKIEFDQGCTLDNYVPGTTPDDGGNTNPDGGNTNPDGGNTNPDGGNTNPEPPTMAEIVAAAYQLASGEAMDEAVTLTGTVIDIPYAYSASYKNMTVVIEVEGTTDQPIRAYRIKDTDSSTDIKTVQYGDTVTITGTLENNNGTIGFKSGAELDTVTKGTFTMPSETEMVNAVYALGDGENLPYVVELTGKVVAIVEEWSNFGNISFNIQVGDLADKPIECWRVADAQLENLKVGDTITLTGGLKHNVYNNAHTYRLTDGVVVEFVPTTDTGDNTNPDGGDDTNPDDGGNTDPEAAMKEIVNAAYALGAGETLADGPHTLTGEVTKIDTAYNPAFGNITVTIQVGDLADKPIQCYRLQGDNLDMLHVGDTITVTGELTNYVKNDKSTIEFKAGCTLDVFNDPDAGDFVKPTTAEAIVNAAYALGSNEVLPQGPYTLTGVITSASAFNTEKNNVTVTIQVGDMADKQIECYNMTGDGADVIKVGDTITVTGSLMNYNGSKVEFNAGCTLDSYVPSTTPDDGGDDDNTDPDDSGSQTQTTSLTYDFSSVTGNGVAITDAGKALETFKKANSDERLVGVAFTKIYAGNGSGGAWSSQGGFLKTGTSSLKGQIKMTYAEGVKVTKVEIKCFSWNTGTNNTVAVNGSATQPAPNNTSKTPEVLTFELDGTSNVVTIDINKRAFIFEITVYITE